MARLGEMPVWRLLPTDGRCEARPSSGDGLHGSAAGGREVPSPKCCRGVGRSELSTGLPGLEDGGADGFVVEALVVKGADEVDDMLGQLHSNGFGLQR